MVAAEKPRAARNRVKSSLPSMWSSRRAQPLVVGLRLFLSSNTAAIWEFRGSGHLWHAMVNAQRSQPSMLFAHCCPFTGSQKESLPCGSRQATDLVTGPDSHQEEGIDARHTALRFVCVAPLPRRLQKLTEGIRSPCSIIQDRPVCKARDERAGGGTWVRVMSRWRVE